MNTYIIKNIDECCEGNTEGVRRENNRWLLTLNRVVRKDGSEEMFKLTEWQKASRNSKVLKREHSRYRKEQGLKLWDRIELDWSLKVGTFAVAEYVFKQRKGESRFLYK